MKEKNKKESEYEEKKSDLKLINYFLGKLVF